jgi:hypothetical protein
LPRASGAARTRPEPPPFRARRCRRDCQPHARCLPTHAAGSGTENGPRPPGRRRETICARCARCAPYLEATGIHRGPVFRRLRRGDTLTDQRLSDQVGRADRQAPRAHGRRPPRRALRPLAARRVRDRRCRRRRRGAQDSQRHPRRTRTSPSSAATSAPRRRSTTSTTCSGSKPPRGLAHCSPRRTAKIRPKGLTALLRASQRPEAAVAADPTGLQSASDEQSGADRPSKSGFPGLGPAYYPFSAYLGCTSMTPTRTLSEALNLVRRPLR